MPYQPFLSHKREEAGDLAGFRDELCLRGAGGWQDQHELRVGQRWQAAFKRAIGTETGGFIWYGTRATFESWTIRRIELPAALRRRRRVGDAYPVVPLFVDVSPGQDEAAIKKAFGRRRGGQLLELNGVVREADENLADFHKRAARAYVRDLVRGHEGPVLRVAVTGNREPAGEQDLSLDWRRLLDAEGRVVDSTVIPTLVETVADIRDAAHSMSGLPHFVVEPYVRLPLAALIGWEWNRVRPVRLDVVQPSARGPLLVTHDVPCADIAAEPVRAAMGGAGPAVLAVSIGKDLGDSVQRYAEAQDACEAVHLHVPTDGRQDRALAAEDIAGLAEWTVSELARLNATGVEKHLLLLGPGSLAVRIGAAANGTGKTFVPFWDGAAGYTGGIVIG